MGCWTHTNQEPSNRSLALSPSSSYYIRTDRLTLLLLAFFCAIVGPLTLVYNNVRSLIGEYVFIYVDEMKIILNSIVWSSLIV